jgi:hypothetical protein
MIRLLDIENNTIKPTEHCKVISWLSIIEEKFPKDYIKIYAYIFYMSCPGEENPYFNLPFDLREEVIIKDLKIDFTLEEDEIIEAVRNARKMYETPTVRAYVSITTMLDNISDFIRTAKVTTGRDGNINSLIKVAKEFDDIRQSYKGVAKDLAAEQESHVRGGQNLGYDQMK